MKVETRRLRPGELNHELIWLSVTVGMLVAALVWLKSGLPSPPCTFYRLTGEPCFTCGMTRSALALFRGDFVASWSFNPLAFVVFCGITLYNVYALSVLVFRTPRLRLAGMTGRGHRLVVAAVVAIAFVNWIYLLNSSLL